MTNPKPKQQRRQWSDEKKIAIAQWAVANGFSEAAIRYEIRHGTIRAWAKKFNLVAADPVTYPSPPKRARKKPGPKPGKKRTAAKAAPPKTKANGSLTAQLELTIGSLTALHEALRKAGLG